jgi:transposase
VARPLNSLASPTKGVPRPSRGLRRAGTTAACAAGFDGTKPSCYKQHRTRPCKERKDGAPTVLAWERRTRQKGRATPPIPQDHHVQVVIESLLSTWRYLGMEVKKLNREVERAARTNPACRRLMTVPGVGCLTSVAYASTVDEPHRFRRAKDLGPYLGLTPRKYQSGEVDHAGSISKCGDRMTRSLLFDAATVLLFRNKRSSALKNWGLKLARRAGTRKARVAVARKLAVLLHRLWTDECVFAAFAAA